MTEAVIVALITASASIAAQLIISARARQDQDAANAARDQAMSDRLAGVEKKLDEHNGYAQRFTEVSIAIVELKKDVEFLRRESERAR